MPDRSSAFTWQNCRACHCWHLVGAPHLDSGDRERVQRWGMLWRHDPGVPYLAPGPGVTTKDRTEMFKMAEARMRQEAAHPEPGHAPHTQGYRRPQGHEPDGA